MPHSDVRTFFFLSPKTIKKDFNTLNFLTNSHIRVTLRRFNCGNISNNNSIFDIININYIIMKTIYFLKSKGTGSNNPTIYSVKKDDDYVSVWVEEMLGSEHGDFLLGILVKENKRGWTVRNNSILQKPVDFFLSRSVFEKIEQLEIF